MGLFYFDKNKLTYEKVPFKTYIKWVGAAGVIFTLGWVSSKNETINKIIHINQIDTNIIAQSKHHQIPYPLVVYVAYIFSYTKDQQN